MTNQTVCFSMTCQFPKQLCWKETTQKPGNILNSCMVSARTLSDCFFLLTAIEFICLGQIYQPWSPSKTTSETLRILLSTSPQLSCWQWTTDIISCGSAEMNAWTQFIWEKWQTRLWSQMWTETIYIYSVWFSTLEVCVCVYVCVYVCVCVCVCGWQVGVGYIF